MPKQFSCCIPKCQTRGTIEHFLNFPSDYKMRRTWITSIPDFDDVVDHETLICTEHFEKDQLTLTFDKYRYTSHVAPSIFPSNSEPHPKKKRKINKDFYPIYMFHLQERDEYPESLDPKMETGDYIFNFQELKANYSNKLGYLMDHWQVQFSTQEAFFFKLNTEDVGRIKSSIKIKDSMHLEVVLSGRIMDPFDLTWVVPPTLLITRWSQLKMLLYEFGVVNGRKSDGGLPTIEL
ncbi:unnamed protein product [Callosobruchus maculatus]|uniref:THAP-type domain-containing protein n=1 Tax=Callosobruchus maculatus TaxID=64391 RepID=A0A653CSY1_CALMS|nr:unnamed protein product [Callosobruchus maculatus]